MKKIILALFISFIFLFGCEMPTNNNDNLEEEYITISFNTNGGSEIPNQVIKKGDRITYPEEPIRSGYLFYDWYLDDEICFFNKYQPTADVTIEAKWKPLFEYSVKDETSICITKGISESLPNHLTIPSTIDGYMVKEIEAYAFSGSSFTKLIIEEGIQTIKTGAFSECRALSSIVFPSSLYYIGAHAFAHCDSLKEIENKNTYLDLTVDSTCFYGTLIEKATVPAQMLPALANDVKLKEVIVYSGRTIEKGALSACTGLQKIVLPNTITKIGNQAFFGCLSLTKIVIPNSVTQMGMCVFENCSNIVIYCEAAEKPAGWAEGWNSSALGIRNQVVWGYSE